MNRTHYKNVEALINRTCGKTFKAYWREMRRHEATLRRIYAKDKTHKCVPEEVGSVNRVHPLRIKLVTFYRCAICMKDLPHPHAPSGTRLRSDAPVP
jgi:hypothetical protein